MLVGECNSSGSKEKTRRYVETRPEQFGWFIDYLVRMKNAFVPNVK